MVSVLNYKNFFPRKKTYDPVTGDTFSRYDVESKVIKLLEDIAPIFPDKLDLERDGLSNTFCMDSLHKIQFFVGVEESFFTPINDLEAAELRYPVDVITLTCDKLKKYNRFKHD